MTAIIQCKDVSKTYNNGAIEVSALRDVSLTISSAEFVSLSGPSGCGKTTLLNIIGGLDRPSAGDVLVEGASLNTKSNSQLADIRLRRIGYVFQAYNLIPVLSALENVEFIMQLQGLELKQRRERSMAILHSVGLDGMENRRPAELSGGQQQRVAVARAIVSDPAIVLADEPTANLDSRNSNELLELMQRLNNEKNITFVVATHDPKVLQFTGRHIQMLDGQIVAPQN